MNGHLKELRGRNFKPEAVILVPILFLLTTNPCTKKLVHILSSLANIRTNFTNELNSQLGYLNDGWISKNTWDKVKAKVVLCFLLVHRKWSFCKIQRFDFNRKEELVCHKPGIGTFWLFLQLQGLFIKASHLESQQPQRTRKGPRKGAACLCLLTFHNKLNTDFPLPCPALPAESFGTQNTEPTITESPPQLSLFPLKLHDLTAQALLLDQCREWVGSAWILDEALARCDHPALLPGANIFGFASKTSTGDRKLGIFFCAEENKMHFKLSKRAASPDAERAARAGFWQNERTCNFAAWIFPSAQAPRALLMCCRCLACQEGWICWVWAEDASASSSHRRLQDWC